ncbi:MAG TPA: MFS transporter [Cyclobacteriaceae bacterium]
MSLSTEQSIKWPEVYALAALDASVAISWIAYHEYQPILIKNFNFHDLASFLISSKAIILVIIPPLAGWLADLILKTRGKYFSIFTIGIGSTAMIFMIVASLIGIQALHQIKSVLPVMLVFWLIAMNLFVSPANSMIEAFAPVKKLPIVMGVIFLVTELIYALEPIIIELIHFFGDTLTFIVGGILIGSTGLIFHRISSDEVVNRKKELLSEEKKPIKNKGIMAVVIVGLLLGLGKALLVEFFPEHVQQSFPEQSEVGGILAFSLLGFAAILAFVTSRFVSDLKMTNVLTYSFLALSLGGIVMIVATSFVVMVIGALIVAASFAFVNLCGLPYAIRSLSVRNITYGVGIFIGASEVFTGFLEIYYQ